MLTHKRRVYAEARVSGMSMKQAALHAGCPARTVHQNAWQLEQHPDVQAHIIRMANTETVPSESLPPLCITDPLDYMRLVMNNEKEDPKLRLDAAKSLASFVTQKAVTLIKKDHEKEAAEKAAAKFAPGAPPKLAAVGGRKL